MQAMQCTQRSGQGQDGTAARPTTVGGLGGIVFSALFLVAYLAIIAAVAVA